MDASNMLKPALRAGEFARDWRDDAEMNTRNTLRKIPRWSAGFNPSWLASHCRRHHRDLRGLKERYEVHHGVRIKDAAILARGHAFQPL